MKRFGILGVALAVVIVAGWGYLSLMRPGSTALPSPAHTGPVSPATRGKVALIIMENEEDSSVIGNSAAPFINSLAKTGAVATNYYAVSHPSLPNYLALIGGSTYGVASDCTDCSAAGSNLGTELSDAGISWRAYAEDYPGSCFTGAGSGEYAKKHVPFLYFASITGTSLCNNVVSYSRLSSDVATGTLPDFVWITPNLCDDMHNCDIAAGDSYLARTIPHLSSALGTNAVIAIVWDEGQTNAACCGDPGGGKVALILTGQGVKPGATTSAPYDHYALLRFIEQHFGLMPLGQSRSRNASSLMELLK